MEQLWWDASVWIALALVASLVSLRIGISVALVELIVGIIAGNTFRPQITDWINFLASFGAIILTFLAGAELESQTLKRFWKESLVLGFFGFFAPLSPTTAPRVRSLLLKRLRILPSLLVQNFTFWRSGGFQNTRRR